MPSSQVETSERPSKAGAWRHSSRKHFVCDIVSHPFRSRLARREPVDPGVVAHEQEPHGSAVALGDPADEFAVGLLAGDAAVEQPCGSCWLCRGPAGKGSSFRQGISAKLTEEGECCQ